MISSWAPAANWDRRQTGAPSACSTTWTHHVNSTTIGERRSSGWSNSKVREPAAGLEPPQPIPHGGPTAAALAAACGGALRSGQPLPTGSNPGGADELVRYTRSQIRRPAVRPGSAPRRSILPPAWLRTACRLDRGRLTDSPKRAEQNLTRPRGPSRRCGAPAPGGCRYYAQMRDLIATLPGQRI